MNEEHLLKRIAQLERASLVRAAEFSALREFTMILAAELAKQSILGSTISRFMVLGREASRPATVDSQLSAAETDLAMQLFAEKLGELISHFQSKLPPGLTVGNKPPPPGE